MKVDEKLLLQVCFFIIRASSWVFSIHQVPSNAVVITDGEGKELPKVIGPINEGSHLSLVCETNGDAPSVVTWWKGTYLLDDSFVTMPEGHVRNELEVMNLRRNDYMTAFTCQAALPNISRPTETSVSVDLNLLPLDVHITSLQRPLSANRETPLTCQSRGSRPAAVLTWWLGSRQLMNTETSSQNDISISTLYYVPAIDDHQRVLSCRSSNPVLDGRILEDHWILNVYYVPQLVVTFGTPQSNIREGDDVYFDCNIQANPAVTEIIWRFNGKMIYTKLTSGIKVNNQSLLLRQVTKENSGNYICAAANVEGEGMSQEVSLDVHYLPFCEPNQKHTIGIPIKTAVQVNCSVVANPSGVIFEWYMNTSITQVPLKHFTTNGTRSTVAYVPKRKTDYGYLFCRARNVVGMQHEPCCFKISPASVPSTVENCSVDNETLSSIIISCEPGFDGGLQQTFHLELYTTKGLHVSLSTLKSPEFEIPDLPSGVSYIAVLFSTNTYGRSNSVALTVQTLPHFGEDAKTVLISPILGVLIVVIGSLVLVAIIIVVGVRHQEPNLMRTERNFDRPIYPYELRRSSVGELKPGQYI